MAEKDFDGVSTKDVFVRALHGIQWTLRIGKHVGDVTTRTFNRIKWRNGNREIGIVNDAGETLYVPKPYVDMYAAARPDVLEKLASVVEEERTLTIGVIEGRGQHSEEKLMRRDKYIFAEDVVNDDEELFPELKHGQRIALEGDLTRGNETSNTLGFKYEGHTLVCFPREGSIVRHKSALFGRVRVHGVISRLDDFNRVTLKWPRIEFTRIEQLASEKPTTADLFEREEPK